MCNGLYVLTLSCPKCGEELKDSGLIQDYYGPYSAYEDQEIFEDGYRGYNEECCVHLLTCGNCGWEEFRPMQRFTEAQVTHTDTTGSLPIFTDFTL